MVVPAPDLWLHRHELVKLLLDLSSVPCDEQIALVSKLYDTPLIILEEILLQISHVCITHNELEVQDLLRKFMLWLAGQSFVIALRLSWIVDSVLDIFRAVGLDDRVRGIQDKIESFAINRRGAARKKGSDVVIGLEVARKEMRLKLYTDMRKFINIITNLSTNLLSIQEKQKRQTELKLRLHEINESLSTESLIYPMGSSEDSVMWIVRIAVDECIVFSSRMRAPFLLCCEVILDDTTTMSDPMASELRLQDGGFKLTKGSDEVLDPVEPEDMSGDETDGRTEEKTFSKSPDVFFCTLAETTVMRAARMRKKSSFWRHPNWGVTSFIVKSGDDLRQEELALQLIDTFNRIWKDAGLTCSVCPYRVLSVGADSGIIEYLDGARSIDSIKKSYQVSCLAEFFNEAFGPKTSEKYIRAETNFVETMAGYSIVSYMLQIKDRHNGNLMITTEGHLVHIDFGFMFVTSPGGLNFESAPFKLSHELLEVMGGVGSAMYNYFKVLVYQGMVSVRDRADDILGLVSLMTSYNTISCFGSDPAAAVEQLRSRFRFDLKTEADFALYVKDLIVESVDNWRTRRYDQFQTLQNGIL